MLIDLHTHSTASDGTGPPALVVAEAADAGVDVLALTDHDTTTGWAAAAGAAEQHGISLVRGIEVSCDRDGLSIHLLSYLQDPADEALLAELETSRTSREHRAELMVARLGEDYPLTWEDVLEHVDEGATIGRPHLADAMVAKGLVADRDEAFATVLAKDSRYHVSHDAPDPVDAVRLVLGAGGVPVLAHALAVARGRVMGEDLIDEMVAAGLVGVEVEHRDHDADARRRLRAIARAHDLLETGASDYHGTGKQNRLGENRTSPAALERIEALGVLPVLRP